MTQPAKAKPEDGNQVSSPGSAEEFRWQSWWQRSGEPIFLLNRRRRLVFVNRAWEQMTGRTLREVHGWACKRKHPDADLGSPEALQHALAPPPEVLQGKPAQTRRRVPLASPALGESSGGRWWDILFFPLAAGDGLLGILGKIRPIAGEIRPGHPLPEKILALREQLGRRFRLDHLPSELPSQQRVLEQIRLACQTRIPVLLVGEPGTGKQWAARAIHQHSGQEGFFAAVDCLHLSAAALADILPGAGRHFHPGTLYLQEPGHLPRELQDRLCQVLQAQSQADSPGQAPRLLAGCAGEPLGQVRAGGLLEDLYCRLSTLTIPLLPLRDRLADLPWLIDQFLARIAELGDRPITGVSPEAREVLQAHRWPGNLRELYTVLREACGRTKGEHLEAGDLPLYLRTTAAPPERALPLDSLLEQVEKRLILLALRQAKNNKKRAAELLSIWRPRLLRRMEALRIQDGP